MMSHRWRSLTLAMSAIALSSVIAAPTAAAAESIGNYVVTVTLAPDAVMEVNEKIVYDFDGEPDRHGIQRDLVLKDALSDGNTQVYGVSVTSVTADGAPVPFSTTDNDDFLSVRIGDPNANVSGKVTYDIQYSVTGAVKALTADEAAANSGLSAGDVELYWDVIGDGWGVPISSAVASIHGPAAEVASACYYGPAGSTNECMIADIQGDLITEPISLGAHESLTVVAAYPASAFTSVPKPTIEVPYVVPGYAWIICLISALIAFFAPIVFVRSRRRALSGNALDGAPVQFEPPDSVRPAQLQAALDGKVDARGAVATLLDLTARGHLTLSAEEGGLLRKDSLTITRKPGSTDALSPWEEAFLNGLFSSSDSKTLAGYDAALASTLANTSTVLVSEAVSSGRRTQTRNAGFRFALVGAGVAGLVLSFVMRLFLPSGAGFLTLIPGLLFLVSCLICMSMVPAKESAESASFQSRARGFKKLLDTDAAEARREFAQRSGLQPFAIFATMLPYAVIFNLSESWTQAFPEITVEQLNSAGYYFGSAWAMQSFIDSTQHAIVMASTEPSRSSGSGFSGGSSGGGGGGGGGGSW